jgi:hypothetical protein
MKNRTDFLLAHGCKLGMLSMYSFKSSEPQGLYTKREYYTVDKEDQYCSVVQLSVPFMLYQEVHLPIEWLS